MSNRPGTTCDHYGCDIKRLQPTCTKGHLRTFLDARERRCIRDAHDRERGPCPDRDDRGQEARDAEIERACDAFMAGRCPDCGGKLDRSETALNVFMTCARCPDVSVRGCKRAGGEP